MGGTLSADPVEIPAASAVLHGDLKATPRPLGPVIFAHGSGSSRFSARNRVALILIDKHAIIVALRRRTAQSSTSRFRSRFVAARMRTLTAR